MWLHGYAYTQSRITRNPSDPPEISANSQILWKPACLLGLNLLTQNHCKQKQYG